MNYPKESIQHSENGESLKSRLAQDVCDNTKQTAQPNIGLKPQTAYCEIIQMCSYSGWAYIDHCS